MNRYHRVLHAAAIVAACHVAIGAIGASQPEPKTTTIVVVDPEQGIYLAAELQTPGLLRDAIVLRDGAHRIERFRDPVLGLKIAQVAANLRDRLRSGEWLLMPGGLFGLIHSEPTISELSKLPEAAPLETGGCFTTFRSRDGRILCADNCTDCYVEKVVP